MEPMQVKLDVKAHQYCCVSKDRLKNSKEIRISVILEYNFIPALAVGVRDKKVVRVMWMAFVFGGCFCVNKC